MITPNQLSGIRVALSIVNIIILSYSRSFAACASAFIVFVVASWTDYLDGQMARKYSLISNFGKILDPLADKILTLSQFAMFVVLGIVSWWLVVFVFAREIIVTLVRFWLISQKRIVGAESFGKIKTGVQISAIIIGFIILMLESSDVIIRESSGARTVMFCVMIIVNAFTLLSGIDFFRKLTQRQL